MLFARSTDECLGTDFRPPAYAIHKAGIVATPEQPPVVGTVVIRDGIIVGVGPDSVVPADAEVIDGTGLIVYPGFIDAATSAFVETPPAAPPAGARIQDVARSALASAPSDNRKGLAPEYQTALHLKFEADRLTVRRKMGFTLLHVVPSGRIASGVTALLSTGDGPPREIVLQQPVMAEFQLAAIGESGYPTTLMGVTSHLRQAFTDARRHALHLKLYEARTAGITRPPHDAAWLALLDVAQGHQSALCLANSRDEILRALDFCAEQGLKPVIWGGREADQCVDRLQATGAPVILPLDLGNEPKVEPPPVGGELRAEIKPPRRVQEDARDQWRRRAAVPKVLHEQKIPFAFSTHGLNDPAEAFAAIRKTLSAGLSPGAALSALTQSAAKIVGQEERLGTVETGKLAHLVVMTGAFDQETSKVRFVFVDGRKFEYNSDAKPVTSEKPASPQDLAGTWTLEIDSADGKINGTLELGQTDGQLSGRFRSEQGHGKLISGKARPDGFEFIVAIGAGEREIILKFAGKLADGQPHQATGTLKSAFGAATSWRGRRPPPSAGNPVALSLDDATPATPDDVPVAATPDLPTDLPTELESDRRARPQRTGGNVFIQQATVLSSVGPPLLNTSVLVKSGKIAAIGPELQPEPGALVIDGRGKFLMPGIIDTHSHIMIADGMRGLNEATLSLVPEVRVKDVVWTEDPSEYRALAGGVTTARLLHGSANVVGGQDAVVKLKIGATAREHILADAPQGVKFALGENVKFQNERFPNTRMGVEATLNRAFVEALEYRRQWQAHDKALAAAGDQAGRLLPPRRDLRLEALTDIVNQQKFIHSHCYRADEILMLLRVASGFGIRVWSLQHVLEGYKVAPEIVAHGASCSTFADWWAYKIEAFDAIPHNAALLQEAGANVVIKSDDWELIRHLYQEAAKTVRYGGMPPEAALRTITLNSARELGLDARLGSIEVGKDADLALFSGHPLNAFSRCEQTLIEGEIYFNRATLPSAMSAQATQRSAQPPTLEFRNKEPRAPRLVCPVTSSGVYALQGGTLHPVDGPEVRATLLISSQRIAAIGTDLAVPPAARVVDVTGLHIYPGMIDGGTTLGLIEVGKVRETHDYAEAGLFQPDLRAGVAVNPDSELIPAARAGGITTILARPTSGIISGQASLVRLAGWTVPDMIVRLDAGLQVNWPGDKSQERIDQLREFLKEGRLYHKLRKDLAAAGQPGPLADPRYDALGPYLAGEKRLFIEAQTRRQIAEALLFAEKEQLQIVICGATDAWKLADELHKRKVPVIVGPVMRKPVEEFDPFDAPYANPGRLHEAGVQFCIRSDSASNSRNVPFEAATAVAYGLPESAALEAVTLGAARILGIDAECGSLTAGKFADIVIADGSVLQPTTQIKCVFVQGVPHAPESRQTRFYDKYRARILAQPSPPTPPVEANVTLPAAVPDDLK